MLWVNYGDILIVKKLEILLILSKKSNKKSRVTNPLKKSNYEKVSFINRCFFVFADNVSAKSRCIFA